jgi:3-oxoadipate CoA-transferase alpha subunit
MPNAIVFCASPDEAVSVIPDGASILIGGFAGGGAPYELVRAVRRLGVRNLTVVSNNFSVRDNNDELFVEGQVRHVISSFPVPASAEQLTHLERRFRAGGLTVETVPQGTLVERIRAGGAGIGGFYTPTGVGTVAAEGKETRIIDGKEYLLELPIKADFAVIRAFRADRLGNLQYRRTARNFNPAMATAAKTTIVQVEEVVETGNIDPDLIGTPGIYVQRVCVVPKE